MTQALDSGAPASEPDSSVVASPEPLLVRPRRRADCVDGPRPCPWVSCRFHLATDVTRRTGRLVVAELAEDAPTCALDVAADGPHTDQEIADALGISRQTANLVEHQALRKLAYRAGRLRDC